MVLRHCGAGPSLVWIHGLGESSTSFEPIVAALPQFQHTLIDLPGYGRSPHAEPIGLDELADRLAPLTRGSLVIGHSMGGVLAVMLAERDAAAAIVNVDGNLSRGDCTFSGRAATWSEEDFLAVGFAELKDGIYHEGFTSLPLRGYHAAMSFASARQLYRHAQELVAISERETMAARQAASGIPNTFIAGVPGGICERSRALLDQHGVHWLGLSPAGHWVYLDQREAFVQAVITAAEPRTA